MCCGAIAGIAVEAASIPTPPPEGRGQCVHAVRLPPGRCPPGGDQGESSVSAPSAPCPRVRRALARTYAKRSTAVKRDGLRFGPARRYEQGFCARPALVRDWTRRN